MSALEATYCRRWVALAALSWLATGALYLTLPPSPDQFHHSYMGWRWIEGDLPYHDFIDMNWPGTIGLHAISVWAFGVHIWSWRATDFLLFALSAVFLADLVRGAEGPRAGKYCLMLSPLIYIGLNDWIPGQHDMSATHFLVAALWFHVRGYECKDWRWQVAAGFFIGAAMLCKPTAGVLGALFPLQAISMRASRRDVLTHTWVLALAALATVIVAMAGIVALGTPLSDLVDAVYTYNVETQFLPNDISVQGEAVHAPLTLTAMLSKLLTAVASRHAQAQWWIAAQLLSLPAFIGWLRPHHRSFAGSAVLALWLTGLLSFAIQSRGFGYHLSPCVPALIAGLTSSISRGVAAVRSDITNRHRTLWFGYVGIASLWLAGRIVFNFYALPQAVAASDYSIHLARFNAGDDLVVSDVVAFAREVEATDKSGCVLAVGTVSAVNYLSERRQPTRFYYFRAVAKMRASMPMAERWISLWEADLKQSSCRYVLIATGVQRDWLPSPTRAAQALRTLLHDYRRSRVLGTTGGMVVYERNHGR